MADIGIEPAKFETYYDIDWWDRLGVAGDGQFFGAEVFGADALVVVGEDTAWIAETPLNDKAKADLIRITDAPEDYLAGQDPRGEARGARGDHLRRVPDRDSPAAIRRCSLTFRARRVPRDHRRLLLRARCLGDGLSRLRRDGPRRRARRRSTWPRPACSRPIPTSTSTISPTATRGLARALLRAHHPRRGARLDDGGPRHRDRRLRRDGPCRQSRAAAARRVGRESRP